MFAVAVAPGVSAGPMLEAAGVEPGVLTRHNLATDPSLHYYLYVPKRGAAGAPVFVSVHGISRNAKEHARMFQPLAERYGVVLVAPRFPQSRFPDYQRLGRGGGAGRSDLALAEILDEVGRLTGARTDRIYLFGYSGGGQFTHRFAMAYPERVRAYVVGAAGWYTFPDPDVPYPRGLQYAEIQFGEPLDPTSFLAVPATVMVGERDVHPGTALRKTQVLANQQGATRYQRGEHWVAAMTRAARAQGLDTRFEFVSLPQSPHSFAKSMRRGNMGERVFEHLFGPPPQDAQTLR